MLGCSPNNQVGELIDSLIYWLV